MAQILLERFATLFAGRKDAWGAVHGQCIKEPVGLGHYRRHLQGKVSMGVYPLSVDGLVRWLAIDIDKNDVALGLAVVAALVELGLTTGVFLERSKGKGFHVLVLFSGWVSAVAVRPIAKAALAIAGLPANTEIFPKQDRLSHETPWGNYLNLPYFGGNNPDGRRMVLATDTVEAIPLNVWLEEVQTVPAADLQAALKRLPEAGGPDPEVQHRVASIESATSFHTTGSRRPTLVSLAGHLRAKGVSEEVAVALLVPWAREHFEPQLPDVEVEGHVRGIYCRYGLPSTQGVSSLSSFPVLEVGS